MHRPNSQTPASRAARQTAAARANQATVAAGGRRLGVLLPPDTAAKLRRIEVPRQTITDWTGDFGEKLAADNSPFPADFEVPIYNVCNQQNGR
jgi:hypothetical protein